ncbi:MAG TPA: TIGR03943 family protein [Thermoleophilaceae bacterium]|jgi:uncharacterized repeat protein (TIGR03943 family)
MSLDRHNVRSLLLLCWSVFLLWMWLTGETARYLGPRTQWLVPFGAVALGVAALAHARAPASVPARLGAGEVVGLVALTVPMLAGLLLAHTQLGALAASKKLTARGIDPTALAQLAANRSSGGDFAKVQVASHNPKFAAQSGIKPGRDLRLEGFVMDRPKRGGAPFRLARFYIYCCVADAVPIDVTVEPADPHAAGYKRDDWLTVSGELVRRGKELRLRGTRIQRAHAPKHPYLWFS